MALMRWSPRARDPFELMRREMDRMLDRYFGEEAVPAGWQNWTPQVDVTENDKNLVVRADLPGVEPKDVDITVQDGSLILRGKREEEKEEKGQNAYRTERFFGEFYREVPLPRGADLEHIDASSSKGVLTVTIPKKPEAQPRKIQVKHAEQPAAQAHAPKVGEAKK